MVEHLLAKEKVAGSNPVFRSIPRLSRSPLSLAVPFYALRITRSLA